MTMENLIPWRRNAAALEDPRPFTTMQRAMSDMFNEWERSLFLSPWSTDVEMKAAGFAPRVDFSEDNKTFHLKAELPGVEEKDLDIAVANGTLTIKGERQEERNEEKRDYYRHECHYGKFTRAIALPTDVDKENISAQFKNGVLSVDIPKAATAVAGTRHIKIKH